MRVTVELADAAAARSGGERLFAATLRAVGPGVEALDRIRALLKNAS